MCIYIHYVTYLIEVLECLLKIVLKIYIMFCARNSSKVMLVDILVAMIFAKNSCNESSPIQFNFSYVFAVEMYVELMSPVGNVNCSFLNVLLQHEYENECYRYTYRFNYKVTTMNDDIVTQLCY